jgi:hypothetical protein
MNENLVAVLVFGMVFSMMVVGEGISRLRHWRRKINTRRENNEVYTISNRRP